MELIKEPIEVDMSTKSEPWTEQELADFRKIMQAIKAKNAKRKQRSSDKAKPMFCSENCGLKFIRKASSVARVRAV